MKKRIIIGSGGCASEVVGIAKRTGFYDQIIGIVEDSYETYLANSKKYKYDIKYQGAISSCIGEDNYEYILAIGNNSFRSSVVNALKIDRSCYPTIVDANVLIDETSAIGQGNIISSFSVLGANTKVGDFNVLTAYSFLSHDSVIGSYNFLSTFGAAGHTKVGDFNFCGIRSTLIPGVCMGNNNTVQAGMIIDKDIGDNETVFYKYKERMQIISK